MTRRLPSITLATALALSLAPLSAALSAPAPRTAESAMQALSDLAFPAGSDVRAASFEDGVLTVDFSPATAAGLTDGALEALTDAVRAAAPEGTAEFRLMADGRSLASFLPPVPDVTPAESPRRPRAVQGGALSGKIIVLSPGHGWTFFGSGSNKDVSPKWQLQRSYYYGIVEDFVNQELIQNVYNLLVNNGATVYTTREMDKTYPDCTSPFTFAGSTRPAPNKPWWQMAAIYYAKRVGAPSGVYDNGRTNDYNRDIAARPLFANALKADLMVSLHNNGFDGTATGTETLYDTSNGQMVTSSAQQFGSQYLAQKIQSHVVSILRANYYSNWYDRRAQGFDGNYGENHFAAMPSCLIEVAFMDRQNPDSNALHDENYKMLVAKGIYEGICDYLHVTPTYNAAVTSPYGSYTPATWNKQWSLKLGSPINAAPSSAGGWVYAGTDAGVLYGVAATPASGTALGLKWKYPATGGLGAPIRARATVYGDRVFAVATNGKLVALNRTTGALLWSATPPNSGNLTAAPAATADGLLVIASDNGRLYAYRQETGAGVVASPAAFGPIRAQVAIPDSGHVWVTSEDGKVRCLSGDLRTILWESAAGAPVETAPFVLTANNTVYVTSTGRSLLAMNASNGGPAAGWTQGGASFGADIETSPWADAASGVVAFGTAAHTILGASPNAPVMPQDLPLRPYGVKALTSDPVVLNGTVYFGGTDGRVYGLKRLASGQMPGPADWRAFDASREPLPGPFNASVCLTGTDPATDLVVAGSANGTLYGLPLQ